MHCAECGYDTHLKCGEKSYKPYPQSVLEMTSGMSTSVRLSPNNMVRLEKELVLVAAVVKHKTEAQEKKEEEVKAKEAE